MKTCADVAKLRERLQRAMIEGAGVLRSPDSLVTAAAEVGAVAGRLRAASGGRIGQRARRRRARQPRDGGGGAAARPPTPARRPGGPTPVVTSPRRDRSGAAASSIAPWPCRGRDRRYRGHGRDRAGGETSTAVSERRHGAGEWPSSGPPDPPAAAVRDAVARALAEDLGPLGDLTAMLVPDTEVARAAGGVARRRGAGRPACARSRPSRRSTRRWSSTGKVPDGAWLAPGSVVAEVSGPMRSILTAERTALNFLCHLSGVATMARRFVDAVCRRQPHHPGARHEKDDTRPARPREGGRARRRRLEPPRRALRRRAGEGQPPGPR